MEISFASAWSSGIKHWRLVGVVATATTAIAIVLALVMRPVYRSETVVLPVNEDGMGALGALAGQFGGLASLAGLSVGKSQARDEAIGVLKSRELIVQLVERKRLMPVLFADDWDAAKGEWSADLDKPPTMGDALRKFDQSILQVREDPKSGLITVRMDWYDRFAAADWANTLVVFANEEMRRRTITEAGSALKILNSELDKAQSVELRTAISRLIEAQLRSRTLASVRRQFAFKVIDPARASDPDKRQRPARTLMVLLGGFIGVIAGIAIALVRDSRGQPRTTD